ncbi:MAG: cytochrome b [Pseudomonadota bacterium]
MALKNTETSWGWAARALHWIIGGLMIFMLGLGFYMTEIVTDIFAKFPLIQLHKSWGFVVFVLAGLRLFWRAVNPTPALPASMTGWEKLFAHGGHIALYLLMFALPLSGWLMSSASPLNDVDAYPAQIKNMVFGVFEMPDPIQPSNEALLELFKSIHFYCALAMAALLVGHAGAALKHHFVDKDNTLTRMITGR